MRTRSSLLRLESASGVFVALLFTAFSLADMFLSLAAFQLGVAEANPVLRHMAALGVFVPAKLAFTLVAGAIMAHLYPRRHAQALCWLAVVVMAWVNVYHVAGLTLLTLPS